VYEYTVIYKLKKIEVTYKEVGGIVWKVLPDEEGRYLIVESRNAAKRKTILSTIDLSADSVLFSNEQLPKPWWVSLKAVGYNVIIFQGYKESNSPEPRGLYVFDKLTGILKWKEEIKIFISFSEKGTIWLRSTETEEASEVDCLTGKLLSTGNSNVLAENFSDSNHLRFPLLYNEDNAHYNTMADFINQHQSYRIIGPLEYLEYESNVLLSFYIKENNKLTNLLLVLNEEGEVLHKDRLMEGADGIGMSSFFICNTKLIYIKNKTSIGLAEMI